MFLHNNGLADIGSCIQNAFMIKKDQQNISTKNHKYLKNRK